MTKAITVRLDEDDHAALERQAEAIGVRPGTLARILVHAALAEASGDSGGPQTRAALERLVSRSRRASGDAVALVTEARAALDRER